MYLNSSYCSDLNVSFSWAEMVFNLDFHPTHPSGKVSKWPNTAKLRKAKLFRSICRPHIIKVINLITLINFHHNNRIFISMINIPYFDEFSSICWTIIKPVSFHTIDNFSSQSEIFIILMNTYPIDEYSLYQPVFISKSVWWL